MRGFHLYAVLLGSLMVAITVGYGVFLASQENSRVSLMLELEKRSRFIPYVDIMREESFATTSAAIRRAFELYLRRNPIEVPLEVYESGDFGEWFSEELVRRASLRDVLASYIFAELKSYILVQRRGLSVELVGSSEAVSRAIEEGVKLYVREDSVIAVIDPSLMSDDVLGALPKLKVCEEEYCRTLSVFPEERTEVTIPLRLKAAFEKARLAYKKLKSRLDSLKFMAGFCKEGCAACGVFRYGWDTTLVYPENGDCKGFQIRLEEFTGEKGSYRITGIQGGGCANLSVRWEDGYIPCSTPETLLREYYRKVLEEFSEDIEGNVYFDEVFVDVSPTKLISYEQVIDIGALLGSATGFDLVLDLLGYDVSGKKMMRVPGTGCVKYGYATCAYPARMRFLFSWRDEDPSYSATGSPMNYTFVIDFGEDTDLLSYVAAQKEEAEGLWEADDTLETDVTSCVERAGTVCTVENVREKLSVSCPGIEGSTFDELWSWVTSNGDEGCRSVAKILIGPEGYCTDPQAACERGVTVADDEELKKCAAERLKDCWKYLASLGRDRCDVGWRKYVCEVGAVLNPARPLVAIITSGGSVDLEDLLYSALDLLGSDLADICIADLVVEKYQKGELGEECAEDVKKMVENRPSPCTDPVGTCLLTRSFRPVESSSELCEADSPAKLRSTFHYNIFDPSYLAVGCYT